jgi:hypothetical protein
MEKYRSLESIVKNQKKLTLKQLFDLAWQKGKIHRRQDNVQHANNVFIGGTFYVRGVGQKAKK